MLIYTTLTIGCTSMRNLPEQKIVPHVEMQKFMGTWYVIASIPTIFEKNAYNAVEIYSWNEKEQRVDIDFSFNKDSFDGPIKKIPQTATIYNKETNSEWRVRPFWPLSFAYLIVDLAPDYSDTIIGVPDRKNVWIMARTKTIPEARYQQLVDKVKTLGYDLSKLQKVPQK